MEVTFTPEIEKKLARLAKQRGCPASELVQDAVAGMIDDVAGTRKMLNRRYDELKNGEVEMISGEEVLAFFREKSATAQR